MPIDYSAGRDERKEASHCWIAKGHHMLDQKAASGVADGPAMTRGKTLLLSLFTSVVSLVLFLGVAEIVLRFLPVSSALQGRAVNSGQPIFHFRPNRNFVNSHGWTMRSVTHHRINNAGFVNDQDYRRDDPLPLVAVVGDSYIEARMVPYAETATVGLRARFPERCASTASLRAAHR
jgi:hypothetical protein